MPPRSDSMYNGAQREGTCLGSRSTICGKKEEKKPPKHFGQMLSQKHFSGCSGGRAPTTARSSSCPGKGSCGAVWRAAWAARPSSLSSPETQHDRRRGLSVWQHPPPTAALAHLSFRLWSHSQTLKLHVCISGVDLPPKEALISEFKKSV